MKTTSIQLFYKLTPTEIMPPIARELERKEEWIKAQQAGVAAEWESKIVKVEYSIFDPAIEDQRAFFNGTIIDYYAIQSREMMEALPDTSLLRRCREEILMEILKYDPLVAKVLGKKRASTTEFREVQAWNTFIKTVEEEIFEKGGYLFPVTKEYWDLVEKVGHDEARRISIEKIRNYMKSKFT